MRFCLFCLVNDELLYDYLSISHQKCFAFTRMTFTKVQRIIKTNTDLQKSHSMRYNANGRSQNALPFLHHMKRPHVTAAVTKKRSLAAIARHGSRKDFFQRGANQGHISCHPYPNWGHAVTGAKNSVPSPRRGFCGPPNKASTPKLKYETPEIGEVFINPYSIL